MISIKSSEACTSDIFEYFNIRGACEVSCGVDRLVDSHTSDVFNTTNSSNASNASDSNLSSNHLNIYNAPHAHGNAITNSTNDSNRAAELNFDSSNTSSSLDMGGSYEASKHFNTFEDFSESTHLKYQNLREATKHLSQKDFRLLQAQAKKAVADLKNSELHLIKTLQIIEDHMVHRWCGYNSLFEYGVHCLQLSRSQSYMYVSLAKATRKYKKLEKALNDNTLTPSKAARVLSVINIKNEQEWITKASTLPKAQLEKEIVKLNPKKVCGEHSRYLTTEVIEMRTPVSEEVYKMLVRVQDLLSNAKGKAVTMEEVFATLASDYLEKNDPLQKAQRQAQKRAFNSGVSYPAKDVFGQRLAIPQEIAHQVHLRDQGQCQHHYPSGERCLSTRWLHVHHLLPVAEGGDHSLNNLITLCSAHHELVHMMREQGGRMYEKAREMYSIIKN